MDTVVCDAIVCWGWGSTDRDRIRLNKMVKRASSVLGCPLDSVEEVVDRRMLAKLTSIMDNSSHPLHHTVRTLSSSFSARLLHPQCRKERYCYLQNFLYDHVQRVRMGPHLSTALSLNIGSGCVLGRLLYTLYTYDCVSTHPDNAIIKFADDTTLVGLISDGDETAYKDKFQRLVGWCADNNFVLNTSKIKELVVDFGRRKSNLQPIRINASQ